MAVDPRFFGPVTVYGSHRHFHSAGECQEARTHVRLDRNKINPAIMRAAIRMITWTSVYAPVIEQEMLGLKRARS